MNSTQDRCLLRERLARNRGFLLVAVVCCGLLWLACSRPEARDPRPQATETPGRAKGRSPIRQHVQAPLPVHVAKSLDLLNAVGRNSANAIPEAILSHTRCAIVVPGAAGGHGKAVQASLGMMSCREGNDDNWVVPTTVTYSPATRSGPRSDLLILVLTDSSVDKIKKSELRLREPAETAPGTLLRDVSVATRGELRSDTVAYTVSRGVLRGAKLNGTVKARVEQDRSASDRNARTGTDRAVTADERTLRTLRSFFNTILPTGIIIHHTATLPDTSKVPASRGEIDNYHAQRGFAIECFGREYHVAYHYLILPNGKIQEGRPERCEGAHALGYNSYLGISVAGDFSSTDNPKGAKGLVSPTPKQIASLIQLCERLQKKYHIPLQHILRHTDVSSTDCPGDRFPFPAVLRKLASTAAPATVSRR